MDGLRRLSKSRFIEGLQCHRRLWWHVHEPDAPELDEDPELRETFDRGNEIGVIARGFAGDGLLVEERDRDYERRIEGTAVAMAAGIPRLFEAAFSARGVFAAVDVLESTGDGGWVIVEVKSGTHAKDVYVADAAVQLFVLRAAGVDVRRVELMLLNRECRYPDLSTLFLRLDVSKRAEEMQIRIAADVEAQRRALSGPLPQVDVGPHCFAPYECPFTTRCFPAPPEHHVSTLFRTGPKRRFELEKAGFYTVLDVPDSQLDLRQRRQVLAVRENRLVVEPTLEAALAPLDGKRVGFLDFETVSPAIPRWNGCAPYDSVPAQFSLDAPDGHHEWIADAPDDPREAIAEALLAAAAQCDVLATWSHFERRLIHQLAATVPSLAAPLRALADTCFDLCRVVLDHVYHPRFHGSFSLKSVAPALAPGMGYDDLELVGGRLAAIELGRLMLDPAAPREAIRKRLLAYCARDTAATEAVLHALLSTRTKSP